MFKEYFREFDKEVLDKIQNSATGPAFYSALPDDYSFIYRPNNTGSKAIGELIFLDKKNQMSLLFIDWGSIVSISVPAYPSAYIANPSDEEIERGLKLIESVNKNGCVNISLNDDMEKIVKKIDLEDNIQRTTSPNVAAKHVVYTGFFDALKKKLEENNILKEDLKTKNTSGPRL